MDTPEMQRMEITEYLDGNQEHELAVHYPIAELRGVWEDAERDFDDSRRVHVTRSYGGATIRLASQTRWPRGARNVKVVYLAYLPKTGAHTA